MYDQFGFNTPGQGGPPPPGSGGYGYGGSPEDVQFDFGGLDFGGGGSGGGTGSRDCVSQGVRGRGFGRRHQFPRSFQRGFSRAWWRRAPQPRTGRGNGPRIPDRHQLR